METFDITQLPYYVRCILTFLSAFVSDICWTFYFLKVSQHKAIASGLWAVATIALGAFVTISFIDDRTLIIPSLLGAFLGTAMTVQYHKMKGNNNAPETK
jgi:hypothetical protein